MVSSCARTKEASRAKYISILNIIQGEVDPTQVIVIYCSTKILEGENALRNHSIELNIFELQNPFYHGCK